MKRLNERGDTAQVQPDMLENIENILARLDVATAPDKMDLPGFRLHPLRGDLRLLVGNRSCELADYLAL